MNTRRLIAALVATAAVAAALLVAAPAEAATPSTLDHVVTTAEATQGKTLAQVEAAWKPAGAWVNYKSEWCAWFVTYLLRNNGVSMTSKDFWVPTLWSTYSKAGEVKTVKAGAKPTVGALIFYGTTATNLTHVGLVVGVSASGLPRTVEGNTGYAKSHPGYYGGATTYATSHVNAFMGGSGTVYGYAYPKYGSYNSATQTGATGSGIAAASAKASGYQLAVDNAAGDMWSVGGVTKDWYAPTAAGSSPATASVGSGQENALITKTGDLWTLGTAGSVDWEIAADAKSNPAITTYGNGYEVAFRRSDGKLETVGSAGTRNWNIAVRSGTSPAIAQVGAGYVVAFEDASGDIRTLGTTSSYSSDDLKAIARAGTSPAIAAVSTGIEVAYQTPAGTVSVTGYYGTQSFAQTMAAYSSPAIVAQPNGYAYTVSSSSQTLIASRVTIASAGGTTTVTHADHSFGFATAPHTSPTAFGYSGGGFMIAAVQSNRNPTVAGVNAAGASARAAWPVAMPVNTSASIAP
jgi:hypothetical protein